MTCRELIEVLTDYLEGALAADVVAALERHLADCAPCRAYLATYRTTTTLTAGAGRLEMPDEMKVRLRRFLLDQLHA
ncbi:MAG TPA: zf-HC2 domain-containing protein [Methylomirabilota bacterium]|jgi:anti-sigma factor RsiW|nr:zf-HC2 domain-containing protein [Methylomirabilota bacterium]